MGKFFIADTHFSHDNIIRYCKRPFQNINQMNETIINNWNKTISNNDEVYHLGDFGFAKDLELKDILLSLNGKEFLVIGGHDYKFLRMNRDLFLKTSQILELKVNDYHLVLCHYCMRVWSKSHFNSFHLFGHSHGVLNPIGKSYDVGVDCNNFTPVSLDSIIEIMSKKPDNENYINLTKIL